MTEDQHLREIAVGNATSLINGGYGDIGDFTDIADEIYTFLSAGRIKDQSADGGDGQPLMDPAEWLAGLGKRWQKFVDDLQKPPHG